MAVGAELIEIVLINPKILGSTSTDEASSSIKRNFAVKSKRLYIIYQGIEGLIPNMTK